MLTIAETKLDGLLADKVDMLTIAETKLDGLLADKVDMLTIAETKLDGLLADKVDMLDGSFSTNQFLIKSFHRLFRLEISANSGGLLIYIKSSLPAQFLSNCILPSNIQAIPLELNLKKRKWLFISILNGLLKSVNTS